jgi:hypothetical protein
VHGRRPPGRGRPLRGRGITPPELLGREAGCADFMLDDLARHGVVFQHREEPIPASA